MRARAPRAIRAGTAPPNKRDDWEYHDGFERVSYRIGTTARRHTRRLATATTAVCDEDDDRAANLTRLFTRMVHLTKLREHLHDEL